MPQQVIDTGFDGCGSVRVSYRANATPVNSPPLEDAEGRYFLVNRTDAALALKIVLEHTLASDRYNGFTVSLHTTGSYQEVRVTYNPYRVEIVTLPYDDSFQKSTYGFGAYGSTYGRNVDRFIEDDYGDGGYYRETRKVFYYNSSFEDENGNILDFGEEPFGLDVTTASQARSLDSYTNGSPNFINSSFTTAITRLATLDGRAIDIDTGAVSGGWSIVVYEVYEWGDSELTRFRFDTDPNPISVKCLDSVCDEDCIPTYSASGAVLCICRDNGEPNDIDDYDYQPYHHNQTQPRLIDHNP
jgi:hypothetical protein